MSKSARRHAKAFAANLETGLAHLLDYCREFPDEAQSFNLASAAGEITSPGGVTYQIQVQLVADRQLWTGENDILIGEATKIDRVEKM